MSQAVRALRHRNFRLFLGGQVISLAGTWMQQVALSWLVYRLTRSAFLLGLVGFTGQLPSLLLAPLILRLQTAPRRAYRSAAVQPRRYQILQNTLHSGTASSKWRTKEKSPNDNLLEMVLTRRLKWLVAPRGWVFLLQAVE